MIENRIVPAEKEIAINLCDHCEAEIGPSPIHEHGRRGYFLACSVAPRDSGPLWMATLCERCMDFLRDWAPNRSPRYVPSLKERERRAKAATR